jgi:Flp pilus assembly protein TadB
MERRQFAKANREEEWEEYNRWLAAKQAAIREGARLMMLSVLLGLVLWVVFTHTDLTVYDPIAPILVVCVLLVYFIGAGKVAKAKRLSMFAGIFWLLMFDNNVRKPPDRIPTGEKPEGAVFSDW